MVEASQPSVGISTKTEQLGHAHTRVCAIHLPGTKVLSPEQADTLRRVVRLLAYRDGPARPNSPKFASIVDISFATGLTRYGVRKMLDEIYAIQNADILRSEEEKNFVIEQEKRRVVKQQRKM